MLDDMTECDLDQIPSQEAERWGGDANLIGLSVVDDCIVGVIPIDRLDVASPFDESPWFDGQHVTRNDVELAILEGRFETTPYCGFSWVKESEWDDKRHAERIAYLVVNKADDPISIEFVDSYGTLEIVDGWHRLAAAFFRGDKEITISIGGYIGNCVSRLGAICREYQKII